MGQKKKMLFEKENRSQGRWRPAVHIVLKKNKTIIDERMKAKRSQNGWHSHGVKEKDVIENE